MRLPKPRTPLPAYMTLPAAAATTGSPTLPSISMPLVLALKPWIILPLAGQSHDMRLASEARLGVGGAYGSTGVTATGVALAGGVEGAGVELERRNVSPICN